MKEMASCSTIDLPDPVIKSRQAVLVDLSVMFFFGGAFCINPVFDDIEWHDFLRLGNEKGKPEHLRFWHMFRGD